MKIARALLLGTLSATLAIAACRKINNSRSTTETDPYKGGGGGPTGYPTTGKSLNELFKDLRTASETQCVTAGVAQTIKFSKGTRLIFYPNSFKDKNGKIITNGTVCIEMTEMYKPGDMIGNRASTTTTDGQLLISGGQVLINVTQNGQKVFANKYGIAFEQPKPSLQSMSLYYGDRDNKDSLTKWTKGEIAPGTTAEGTISDSSKTAIYIFDSCTDFNLINCDQLSDVTSPRTQVNIVMPDASYNNNNCMAFILLPSMNAAIAANVYSVATKTFDVGSDHPLHMVPVGLEAKIAAVCFKNGDYYYFEKKGLTISDGMTVNAIMTKTTLDDVKLKLGAL